MTEDALSSKMHEFMTILDQVKKYRAIVASMTDFALIMMTTGVATVFLLVTITLRVVFDKYLFNIGMMLFLAIVVFIVGIAFALLSIIRKVNSVTVGEWKNTLNEGTPGAIKLLREINWENVFSDIRLAKLGYSVYGAVKIFAYWLATTAVLSFLNGFLEGIFHVNIVFIITALFSLVLVLFFSRKDLRKRYSQVGRLDSLLWELRWFDSEFRRANFQA
jgi:hypothetical protein